MTPQTKHLIIVTAISVSCSCLIAYVIGLNAEVNMWRMTSDAWKSKYEQSLFKPEPQQRGYREYIDYRGAEIGDTLWCYPNTEKVGPVRTYQSGAFNH